MDSVKNMAVLLAIRHPHASHIYDGTKKVELRRNRPMYEPGTGNGIQFPFRIWMYESGHNDGPGVITGWADCFQIRFFDPSGKRPGETLAVANLAQVTVEELLDYAGQKGLWLWHVKDAGKLEAPVTLEEIGMHSPPQSWRYLPGDTWAMLEMGRYCGLCEEELRHGH